MVKKVCHRREDACLTFHYPPQSRVRAQVLGTRAVVFVHIDDVPVVRPDGQSEEDETEQTCKSSAEDHQCVPHCRTADPIFPREGFNF